MATEMITLRLESKFLSEIDLISKRENYQNRTEFIRSALREKIDQEKFKEGMLFINQFRGIKKSKTTLEEYRKIRKEAGEELERMTEEERKKWLSKFNLNP